MRAAPALLVLLALAASGCFAEPQDPALDVPESMRVVSPAFAPGERIPARYACEPPNLNVSPPLEFQEMPDAAVALALVMDDPDAPSGTFTHWTFWNLPASRTALAEDAGLEALGAVEGQTSSSQGPGYRGPCPPPGDGDHRYFFKAYALDATLNLSRGATLDALEAQLDDHAIARGTLMGTYSRG